MRNAKGRLPDFIIIGAAKSGTTSLWHYLSNHPDIFMSHPKEPCYFDEDATWSRGIEWYCSLFAEAQEHHVCGEASTNYTRWPQVKGVPEKIYSMLPGVKLIYVMRNPVDRAFSHYVHRWTKEMRRGLPFSQSFLEYCNSDRMCIDSSMYYMQLEQYLQFFSKEQILPVVFEELLSDPRSNLSRVSSFLGVDVNCRINEKLPLENENIQFRYHLTKNAIRDRLRGSFAGRISMKFLPSSLKSLVYERILLRTANARAVQQGFEPIPLTESERVELRQLFAEPNQELLKAFSVDISRWE